LADLAAQISLFIGFVLLGYLISRFSGKGRLANDYVTALLIKLLVPLLVIYTLLTASPETLAEIPTVLFLAVLVQLLGPAIMFLRLRGRDVDNATKGVFYISVTFTNAVFIPLPLVMMFMGERGVPFVVLFSLTQFALLVTLGSLLGSAFTEKQTGWKDVARRALTFPPLLAAILAVALIFTGSAMPETVASVLSYSGTLTTYLALVSVGLGLGVRFSLSDVRAALEVVAIRQVIVPLLMVPIVFLSGLSAIPSRIVILEALMPPAVLTVAYAGGFGLDSERAATIVTVGTLLLLPVLPFVPLLLS